MRLPRSAHLERPWRIHAIAREKGLELEDVWQLPITGRREDFPRLVETVDTFDPDQSSSLIVRTLFAVRWKLGELFGWDEADVRDAPFVLMRDFERQWRAVRVHAGA